MLLVLGQITIFPFEHEEAWINSKDILMHGLVKIVYLHHMHSLHFISKKLIDLARFWPGPAIGILMSESLTSVTFQIREYHFAIFMAKIQWLFQVQNGEWKYRYFVEVSAPFSNPFLWKVRKQMNNIEEARTLSII